MWEMNRRRFVGLVAATTGVAAFGTGGCTIDFSESSTPVDDIAAESSDSVDLATSEAVLSSNMAASALEFLNGLNEESRSQASYVFGSEERFRWHWTRPSNFPRNGLPLRAMTEEQKLNALDLLKSGLSNNGFEKALNIMSLQRDLGSDPEDYYVTIFGTPDSSEPWGWRWEGHHLSLHYTVVGDQVATMPFFLGAWPTLTDAGKRAMPREEDVGLELVNSLTGDALSSAIFQEATLRSHVTQNNAAVSPLDPIGLLVGDMNDAQQRLVDEIVQTYTQIQPSVVAQPNIDRITTAGLENARFAWAGSLEYQNPQYYRLQGPTFLLEFDNSRNSGTHIHSVWRDFERDFGYHLL